MVKCTLFEAIPALQSYSEKLRLEGGLGKWMGGINPSSCVFWQFIRIRGGNTPPARDT